MQAFEAMVEKRIGEAVRRGDFDDLPGSGRPLELDASRSGNLQLAADYFDRLVGRLA